MSTAPKPQYKRSWKNLLISARYQLGFTLFMVVLCAILEVRLGIWVMTRVRSATNISIGAVQANEAYLKNPAAEIQHLRSRENLVRWLLIGTGALLTVGLFVYGIKMTHKVAGPLHKVALYLDKVKGGKFDKVWPLRKGDQLVAFYDHFREAHEALRKRQEKDVERLREVIAAADKVDLGAKAPDAAARLEELKGLLATKEASLG